jgi:hypothetical protein
MRPSSTVRSENQTLLSVLVQGNSSSAPSRKYPGWPTMKLLSFPITASEKSPNNVQADVRNTQSRVWCTVQDARKSRGASRPTPETGVCCEESAFLSWGPMRIATCTPTPNSHVLRTEIVALSVCLGQVGEGEWPGQTQSRAEGQWTGIWAWCHPSFRQRERGRRGWSSTSFVPFSGLCVRPGRMAGTARPTRVRRNGAGPVCYRSLMVAKARAAKAAAISQKRTTTWGSLQPAKWKWWCRGAQRKRRLPPVYLK